MKLMSPSAVPELVRTVAGWLYAEWGCKVPGRSIDTAESSLRQDPGADGLPSSIIAVLADEPVGVARLVATDLESRPDLSPWLASVYVHADKRNRDIGSILCSGIVEIARRNGFHTLYLFTPDRASFYQRQGWSVMGDERHQGVRVTLMKFDLNAPVMTGPAADF